MQKRSNHQLTESRVRTIVHEEINSFEQRFDQTFDEKLEQKLDEQFRKRIDPLMDHIDDLITQVKKSNEEYAIQVSKITQYTDEIDSLDKRVTSLEKRQLPSQSFPKKIPNC